MSPRAFSPVLEELLEGGERSWGCAESKKLLGKRPLKGHLQHPSCLTARLRVPAACPLSSPQPVPSVPSPCRLPAPYRSCAALGAVGRVPIISCSSLIAPWPPAAWHSVPAFGVALQPPRSSREGKIRPEDAEPLGCLRAPPGASLPASPSGFFLRAKHRFPSPHRPAQHRLAWTHPHGWPHRPRGPLSRRWVLLSPLGRAPWVARWVPGLLLATLAHVGSSLSFSRCGSGCGSTFEVSLLIFLISSSKQMSFLPAR